MKINIKNLMTPLINIYGIELPLKYPPEGSISPVQRVSSDLAISISKKKRLKSGAK